MRHIEKDLNDCPVSLMPATNHFFKDGNYPKDALNTHNCRMKMVGGKEYSSDADSLYKAQDVKEKLENLYFNKCAYCEQRIEQYHVEHYRPKRAFQHNTAQQHEGYPWLSLSWDNLMLACPKCNEKKGSKFDIKGNRATVANAPQTDSDWNNIHYLSRQCDQEEQPLLLNPERCNPEDHFAFAIDGTISSKTEEGKYTIETCKLDRTYLNDKRREVINHFVRRLAGIIERFSQNPEKIYEEIIDELAEFNVELEDVKEEFTMFRKQAKNWYAEMIKQAMTSNKVDIQ